MRVKLSTGNSLLLFFFLPVIPADEAVKGLGKMLKSFQPSGHRLQILVKFSVPRWKQDGEQVKLRDEA